MQYIQRLILSILAGLIAGLIGGLLGIAGVLVIIPVLLVFGIFTNHHHALGTVLFGVDPIQSFFSIVKYAKQNKIEYLLGISIFISYFVGSYLGTKVNYKFTEKTLKYITAAILFLLAFYMLFHAHYLNLFTSSAIS